MLADEDYTRRNCQTIVENRAWTTEQLVSRNFTVLDSKTNFVFAKHASVSGEYIYTELKSRGVLVRHFTSERICDYNRITIGSKEQMETLIKTIDEVLAEKA